MKLYTKPELIEKLREISEMGWIRNARHGNDGGVGNTLEDLLGIEENNLPIPNASEWELKSQRLNSSSLTTLFHVEPSPRAVGFIPSVFLPNYGWKHRQAGLKYPENEMSFRMTIHGLSTSERGFMVKIDKDEKKVLISFDASTVAEKHKNWLNIVRKNIGLDELNPQPYWGFDDLASKAGTKLLNCFYVQAEVKKFEGIEHYKYCKVMMLQKFKFDGFLNAIESGHVLVDFDARTGHNHGTKFRLRQNCLPMLYEKSELIISI
jgi:hypothetical protein